MHRDVSIIIQDYDKCKEQSTARKRAKIRAMAAGNAWLFSYWGVSILGPLPMALGGLKFLAVAIEHSTKWVEAMPITIGLKITQSFSPITEHMEITSRIEKQLTRSQQGWVDDLPQVPQQKEQSFHLQGRRFRFTIAKQHRKPAGLTGSSYDKRSLRRRTLQDH
ncbi:hypothetical protein Tco_0469144 [Tanacetum coccineum]